MFFSRVLDEACHDLSELSVWEHSHSHKGAMYVRVCVSPFRVGWEGWTYWKGSWGGSSTTRDPISSHVQDIAIAVVGLVALAQVRWHDFINWVVSAHWCSTKYALRKGWKWRWRHSTMDLSSGLHDWYGTVRTLSAQVYVETCWQQSSAFSMILQHCIFSIIHMFKDF